MPRLPIYETVLPKKPKALFDKKRGEWFLAVRVRRRASKGEFTREKVWLGAGDPIHALTAAVSRLQMAGASHLTKEAKKQKHDKSRSRAYYANVEKHRDVGIRKVIIRTSAYQVWLIDPLTDGKKIYFGTYKTMGTAREVRTAKYKELRQQVVPCAVCGVLPKDVNGQVGHISATCPNKIKLPLKLRPLCQVKLWNFLFSKGDLDHPMRPTLADLEYLGITRPMPWGGHTLRADVELDTRLAAGYATERPDPVFE